MGESLALSLGCGCLATMLFWKKDERYEEYKRLQDLQVKRVQEIRCETSKREFVRGIVQVNTLTSNNQFSLNYNQSNIIILDISNTRFLPGVLENQNAPEQRRDGLTIQRESQLRGGTDLCVFGIITKNNYGGYLIRAPEYIGLNKSQIMNEMYPIELVPQVRDEDNVKTFFIGCGLGLLISIIGRSSNR